MEVPKNYFKKTIKTSNNIEELNVRKELISQKVLYLEGKQKIVESNYLDSIEEFKFPRKKSSPEME